MKKNAIIVYLYQYGLWPKKFFNMLLDFLVSYSLKDAKLSQYMINQGTQGLYVDIQKRGANASRHLFSGYFRI